MREERKAFEEKLAKKRAEKKAEEERLAKRSTEKAGVFGFDVMGDDRLACFSFTKV